MDSLKKSFKSYGSQKHSSKTSTGRNADDSIHEDLPILLHQETGGEVVVKINDAHSMQTQGNKIWREPSYDFWTDGDGGININNIKQQSGDSFDFRRAQAEDPPSQLIGKFLDKQKLSGETSLDMDLEMEELQEKDPEYHKKMSVSSVGSSPTVSRINSKDLKVSFEDVWEDSVCVRQRYSNAKAGESSQRPPQPPHHRGNGIIEGEVVRCTSFERNISMQKINNSPSTLLKTKTRSRLMDPPPDQESGRLPPKSGQLLSGLMGNGNDEDDPFWEEDLPDKYTRTHFSLWILLEWLSLVLIITALITTLSIPLLSHKNLWELRLWKWEVMILVLICGRLVSDWVIRMVVFCIERNFLLRKRVLYFVYGVRKPVQNCFWLGLALIAWHLLFDKKVETETKSDFLEHVTKVLVCFLVGTLVWLVKTLMVKVLASSFHVSTYFDRIQHSLFNQFVIETLSGPRLIELQKTEEEEEKLADEVRKLQNAGVTIPPDLRATAFSRVMKSGTLLQTQKSCRPKSARFSRALSISKRTDDGITIDQLHKLNPKNVSAWNMKRLMNIVRHGALTTLDEQILDSAHDDEHATQIRSENEAKAAAKKIFQNVAGRGRRYIYLEDLMRFVREDEAVKTLNLFEGASETGKISKSALKNWVVNAFRERRALALTLNDTKTAVNKLHRMLNFLVGIVILVIWLLILEIATSEFFLFVSSQLVLVAFIFGNTCKTIFEAIIFLFVMHPFDVGDRCEVDGVQMVVEEMNILTTVFLRFDNQKIMIPNSVLATKAINNYYRSPDMGDAVEFCVHVSTPAEKIALIKHRMQSYIDNKKEHWYPSPMIVFKDHEHLNMVRMAVWPTHRMNHQDMGERFIRRSLLIEEMIKIFKELDIHYRLLPLDISIRTMPTPSERLPPSWTTITS